MGTGSGFIFDAIRKVRENRAIRTSNRNKFNGNYSGDTILNAGNREKIEFPTLPKDQVAEEREKNRIREQNRKRNRIWFWSILIMIFLVAFRWLWNKTQGLEYWEFFKSY
jgi:hypothetical protein